MKVSESIRKMCDVLSCIPPDFKTAETLFAEQQPTEQELMWLAVELADNTFGEYRDMLNGINMLCQIIKVGGRKQRLGIR